LGAATASDFIGTFSAMWLKKPPWSSFSFAFPHNGEPIHVRQGERFLFRILNASA
jgi:hypothetical protein